MRITKCDMCKKQIKGDVVHAGVGIWRDAELCKSCGAPILEFLVEHQFAKLEEEK